MNNDIYQIPYAAVEHDVRHALQEDVRTGDLTALLIDESQPAAAKIIAREYAILCGQPWFNEAFRQVEPSAEVKWNVQEGARIEPNQVLVEVRGSARALVTAERTALNFLQLLSGTASTVDTYVQAVAGTGARVVDSRKTIPGLRQAQKYAVRVGGGLNHRMGLYDGILIKENHIATAGGVVKALQQAQHIINAIPPEASLPFVQIEIETLEQLKDALTANARMILLDNMTYDQIRQAVQMRADINPNCSLEVSGNVTLESIRGYAQLGVDRISSGGLTKHVRAVDYSMRVEAL